MKKIFISVLFILTLIQCATKPEIIRTYIPFTNETVTSATNNIAIIKINGIEIHIKYLNKIELQKLAEKNNPYLDSNEAPLLTTFKITIYNNRDTKIEFEPKNAILLDGLGNQFSSLTYDMFKELYPSTVYKEYQYSFIFNRYYMEEHYTDDYYKRGKAGKTLFKGGKIYPKVHVTGILAFPRVSAKAREVTLVLPDIKFYNKNKEIVDTKEIEIKFKQKLVRTK